MRKYYLASHGELAAGILSSMNLIVGEVANIRALALEKGSHPDNLADIVREDIRKSGEEVEFVIFTDIAGGSVNTAMTKLCSNENVTVISGMNLGLVLEFVLSGCYLPVEEAAINAINTGKEGMVFLNKKKLDENIKSEGEEEIW
ncbi:PTS system mannose-specific transporter subunits IIAB [uncultured Clostridium sp.]|uniref:PTS sugar transporter subunit IIA n=1 Tax=uncultured Clostridium sp. TaxID=59620 RepID=UPI0008205981|nr:hypothetical protein [uncultured Clostridium sp.]SCJ46233.1 PTS system mannose-specific transporter subunits IIAB [uncultured Clostridium sp.]